MSECIDVGVREKGRKLNGMDMLHICIYICSNITRELVCCVIVKRRRKWGGKMILLFFLSRLCRIFGSAFFSFWVMNRWLVDYGDSKVRVGM